MLANGIEKMECLSTVDRRSRNARKQNGSKLAQSLLKTIQKLLKKLKIKYHMSQ